MEPALDVAQLSPQAQRILDPKTPAAMRTMAARGIAPGLKPADTLAVLALLAESTEPAIATQAQATLGKLPPQLISGALTPDLHPGVLDSIAIRYATDAATMERILALPQIALETVARIAMQSSEAVSELIATNEDRLLRHPAIIERLYMNKATRMSTSDRMIELAVRNHLELTGIPAFKEAAAAIGEDLIDAEPSAEPTEDDIRFREAAELAEANEIDPETEDTHEVNPETGEEVVREKMRPLYTLIGEMKVAQKIRLAQTGGPSERAILVRDMDRRVAAAAIKNPNVQDNEVARISAARNISEDVLRIIASNREWTRNHQVKVNLVSNPRTPLAFASRLIPFLREHELKGLSKSKNVSGAVRSAVTQQLNTRTGKGK